MGLSCPRMREGWPEMAPLYPLLVAGCLAVLLVGGYFVALLIAYNLQMARRGSDIKEMI